MRGRSPRTDPWGTPGGGRGTTIQTRCGGLSGNPELWMKTLNPPFRNVKKHSVDNKGCHCYTFDVAANRKESQLWHAAISGWSRKEVPGVLPPSPRTSCSVSAHVSVCVTSAGKRFRGVITDKNSAWRPNSSSEVVCGLAPSRIWLLAPLCCNKEATRADGTSKRAEGKRAEKLPTSQLSCAKLMSWISAAVQQPVRTGSS